MDSSRKAALTEAGINVDDALERFMGNEMLLERFWKKFRAVPRIFGARLKSLESQGFFLDSC